MWEKEKIFIIAEIGINHNGDLSIAKKLIDMAKECGCDAVKFQKRTIDIVYTKELLDSPRESPWGNTQREQKEGLEFGKEEYDEIDRYCKEKGIIWFASAWDLESQKFLKQYDLKYNKVASAMLTHYDLLEMIAQEKKHTFISCGMSDWGMIDKALEVFEKKGCVYTLLHCVSTYPSDDEECNLNAIKTLKKKYGCEVGYSGHERGVLPSILAVAAGAVVLERHVTLDRTMYGSDQAASLEHRGLELLVRDARRVKDILGDGNKAVSEKEASIAKKLRYYEE
ncbi:MAG: N-acetylneuraminate synthase family protein [Candidatus Omnitrophica bacterium]|nr:N-acetylneuraminate synthase family protein [Candidatus Omnitrophota bacterium]